jgi:hypothetical protein
MPERAVTTRQTAWPAAWGAPRLLRRAQVRAYLQIEEREMADRMRRGQLPGPLWGCDPELPSARWDRQAVDRAVNRASAIPDHTVAATEELDREFGFRA